MKKDVQHAWLPLPASPAHHPLCSPTTNYSDLLAKNYEMDYTLGKVNDIKVLIAENKVDLENTLKEVVAEAVNVKAQLDELLVDFAELVKIAQVTRNVTSQFLTDLQILKGRQVVSGGVQGVQVFMFVAYLVTIAVLCLVKHCNKHRERVAQLEFELLKARLQASKAKRRAAAARAQPEITSRPNPSRK